MEKDTLYRLLTIALAGHGWPPDPSAPPRFGGTPTNLPTRVPDYEAVPHATSSREPFTRPWVGQLATQFRETAVNLAESGLLSATVDGMEMIAMEMPGYDVVVVGGGAAGLSAALVLDRARRRIALVDAGAPRNALAAHMQGFLSRDGMSPTDLLAAGRAEVTGYGVELLEDHVVGVEARSSFVSPVAGC